MESYIVFAHIYIYILYINVPKPYQLSRGRVRHLGAGSCFGVAGLVRVFCRLTHKYIFCGFGRRTTYGLLDVSDVCLASGWRVWSMQLWYVHLFLILYFCLLVTNYDGFHDSDQNLDLNASLHADYIINNFYIIIRLYL